MKKIFCTFCFACFVFLTVMAVNELDIPRSYFKLTTSNGLIVSVYDTQKNRIDYVYPHIFGMIDSAKYVHPFVGDIRLKNGTKPLSTAYAKRTHVICSVYPAFEVYYFASFIRQDKVFYAVIRGKKEKISGVGFTAETGDGKVVPELDHIENPLEDLPCRLAGRCQTSSFTKQYKDGLYEKYVLYTFTDSLHTDTGVLKKTINELQNMKGSLVDAEISSMRKVINSCRLPQQLTRAERETAEQSITILKMAQVSDKEIFPHSHGQVLASLRPGLWHIAWVRDGSFAIEAMTRVGLFTEARKGLEFMLEAPANRFKNYIYKDKKEYGPGVDYRISLTRYFGNGKEECDYNEFGPNIEYDDFGLFLTAFSDYVTRTNDKAFFTKWYKTVTDEVAKAIVAVVDTNGLIKADSGPWEHHLEKVKQYAFTSAVNARGLEMFVAAEKKFGVPTYSEFEQVADRIKKAILTKLWVNNAYLKGNVNDISTNDHEYWDAGTFESFANGLLTDKQMFASHLSAYNKTLRIEGERDGYIRLRSNDPYENQEWGFINLRIALAHVLNGNKPAAAKMIGYVTRQAVNNFHTIPEMYSNAGQMKLVNKNFYQSETWCNCIRFTDGAYIGTIPMVGYGSGAYLIALLAYYGK